MPCCHGHPEVVLLAEGWASSEVGLCEGEEGCSDTTGCLERSPSQEECKGVWEGREVGGGCVGREGGKKEGGAGRQGCVGGEGEGCVGGEGGRMEEKEGGGVGRGERLVCILVSDNTKIVMH